MDSDGWMGMCFLGGVAVGGVGEEGLRCLEKPSSSKILL